MSQCGTSPEFERKMQEIGARIAHMVIPRSEAQQQITEYRYPAWTEDEENTMNEREALAKAVFVADNYNATDDVTLSDWEALVESDGDASYAHRIAQGLIQAGYRRPRTITTVEEIKDLPALAVVLYDDTANGGLMQAYVVPDDGTVMFKDRYPFHLMTFAGDYIQAEDIPLPLRLVYEANP